MLLVLVGPSSLPNARCYTSNVCAQAPLSRLSTQKPPALFRITNPSLGVLKSVTSLDIYRFIAFMFGCVSGVKPAIPSLFLKPRNLTSVIYLTF